MYAVPKYLIRYGATINMYWCVDEMYIVYCISGAMDSLFSDGYGLYTVWLSVLYRMQGATNYCLIIPIVVVVIVFIILLYPLLV